VTCYTRHLGELLPEDATADDRRRLDATIREVLGLSDAAGCPDVWAAVKAADRSVLDERIRRALTVPRGRG
jgi:hypothetical protein